MADNAKSRTVEIAEEMADAMVVVVNKISPVCNRPSEDYSIIRTAESIALAAYQAAHPSLWATTAMGAQIESTKEN